MDTQFTLGRNREMVSGFDYDNQAWVRNGHYIRCGHPTNMKCGCFGLVHDGELISEAVAIRVSGINTPKHPPIFGAQGSDAVFTVNGK